MVVPKEDILKWVALTVAVVSIFYISIGTQRTVEDYKTGMSSQSAILEK